MPTPIPIRLALLLSLAAPAFAQAGGPVFGPLRPSSSEPTPSSQPARPQVIFTDHQLTIRANNSSLNQILHEVSQIAGITITGGVTDERVFGGYGPAPVSQVLNQLLDGTSSNMLFISSTEEKPAQLILTPRAGGPTPPNPNAMHFDDNAEADTQAVNPPEPPDESRTQPPPPPPGTPSGTQPGDPSGATPNASAATDSKDQSSNGVRTPQQIFDQLMKLRQQQQQQQK